MRGLVSVTVHGGVGEIGGNKVLVESAHGSAFLDFGLSFGEMARYYCEFCSPRSHSFLGDQVHLGILPDLEGVYREDLLGKAGMDTTPGRCVDAVFLSHAHMDHVGMVPVLRPDTPLHMLAPSRAVLQTLDTAGIGVGLPDRLLTLHEKFKLIPRKDGKGLKRGQGRDVEVPRDVRVVEPGQEVEVAPDLAVRTLPVDHSLPGASALVLHADGRTLVYTGDLRFHGRRSHLSRDFVQEAASEDVDVLLTEGTRVTEAMGRSEAEVEGEVARLVGEAEGMVLVNYPGRDLDRIVSFHRAAMETGRELVVDLRQALLLDNLAAVMDEGVPRLGEGIRVMPQRRRWAVVGDPAFPQGVQAQDYDSWQRRYAFSPHRVLDAEVRDDPGGFVVFLDFFHLQALMDLRPEAGSLFIRSVVEPFDEELLLDERRVDSWMDHFGLRKVQVHASGHACDEDLRGIVESLEPGVVVPIHTERPDAFGRFHDDVRPPVPGASLDL